MQFDIASTLGNTGRFVANQWPTTHYTRGISIYSVTKPWPLLLSAFPKTKLDYWDAEPTTLHLYNSTELRSEGVSSTESAR